MHVLVVDDNASLAEDLGEILEQEGYTCSVFSDPHLVASKAEKLKFDVALVDMRMPGLDGVQLYKALREHQPDALYLLMTAFSTDERAEQAREAGVRVVLQKPLPVQQLLERLPKARSEVLVVSRDAALIAALSKGLAEHGYTTRVADGVEEARATCAEALDAAVIDLPEDVGVSLAGQMVQRLHGGPVILCSDCAEDEIAGGSNTRVRLLAKPVAIQRLLETLRGMLATVP